MKQDKQTYILTIDQGTSGTGASLYDHQGARIASTDVSIRSIYPQPGWVEQDPFELLASIKKAAQDLITQEGLEPGQIDSMGVANQGECLLLWDLNTGKPVYNMIGWQCVRSAKLCEQMIRDGLEEPFRKKTGLPLDPEWPATKMPWAVENIPEIRELFDAGRLAFSQSDSWFMHHLTKEGLLLTDHSTASRSGFYNIQQRDWDESLIELFQGSKLEFPKIIDSSGYFGEVDLGGGWRIPWRGNALDQPAALLGQGCIHPGDAKVTYGTCAGFWYNLGHTLQPTKQMDASVAWQIEDQPSYAVVGEAITAGEAIVWLRNKIKIPWSNAELSEIAQSAKGQDDLIFVSALSGLGAPYWAPQTQGALYGITGGTSLEHLVRAGLEAVAYSVRDLLEACATIEGHVLPDQIKVDGGMTANDYLMQFQADLLGKPILVPSNREGTSNGVAMLAGLSSQYYPHISLLVENWSAEKVFQPQISDDERETRYQRWKEAVHQTIAMYKS